MLEPGKVGVPGRRHPVLPPHVLPQLVRTPVREIKRRICHDEVGLELEVAVVKEGVGAELTQVSVNAPDGKIHLGEFPSGWVGVLPIDRNAVDVPAMVLDKPSRLDEHAAAAAAGVIDPPIEGLEHFHQRFDHTLRREELPGQFALLLGEFAQAVLVGVPQNILAAAMFYHLEVGKQIDHIPQPPLV